MNVEVGCSFCLSFPFLLYSHTEFSIWRLSEIIVKIITTAIIITSATAMIYWYLLTVHTFLVGFKIQNLIPLSQQFCHILKVIIPNFMIKQLRLRVQDHSVIKADPVF